ncbi:probable jasmonic acid carboxyl methyltransferase 2 [Mercurialis annua]|uniref:probable jasmonic acid carboxyl methyltransferase 2 n=1 Tax=Mercurialis annua TaxID=3986 RepID=UPI0021602844|nr:probable jasmonic acid carboxyl methyltransferase 2 [Mercurialis annua]
MSSQITTIDLKVPSVLHMNGGKGKNSYYRNSLVQKEVISKTKHILEECIAEMCSSNMPECVKIVEMGCSSGPTALVPLWEIIETIESTFKKMNKGDLPILQVFMNDLQENDFNTIFSSLVPEFYEKLKRQKGEKFGQCFIGAVPGSFYGRLFPPNSLHFVHSSSSLHWCSQVPEGVVSETGIPLNKGNICIAKTSPRSVHEAYSNQFVKDFTAFLVSRSEEMAPGGRLALTFMGRNDTDPSCKYGCEIWQLLGIALMEMVQEGLIEETKLDMFNIPVYAPSAKEVERLIEKENLFSIKRFEEVKINWDANIEDGNNDMAFDKWERGDYVATYLRAAAESMVVTHFGDAILDDLFHRFSLKAADYLENKIGYFTILAISILKN